MLQKLINRFFVIAIIGFLVLGLVRTVWFPKDVNYYENRTTEKIATFSVSRYKDTTFQDQFENGLMDQIPFSQRYKKAYNTFCSNYLRKMMTSVLQNNPNRYISYMGMSIFGVDHITHMPRVLSDMTPQLDKKIKNYNTYFDELPNLDFYVYYIERDIDVDFETNKKVGAYEYIQNRLDLPRDNIANFVVNNFDDFSNLFYKTDHHWNYKGSYLAYTQVAELLGIEDTLITPIEEETLPYVFSGSRAAGVGAAAFNEKFTAYKFPYPNMNITIDGKSVSDYGNQDEYFAHKPTSITYSDFYGGGDAEIVFDTNQPDKENILIIGESYDNAILKLLASHYNKTYSIDLRSNNDFHFTEYVKKHNISKVLLIGNMDYFLKDEFLLED